jgi:hypothetical protein
LRQAWIERDLAECLGSHGKPKTSRGTAGFAGPCLKLQAVFAVKQACLDAYREGEPAGKSHRVANRLCIVRGQRPIKRRRGEPVDLMQDLRLGCGVEDRCAQHEHIIVPLGIWARHSEQLAGGVADLHFDPHIVHVPDSSRETVPRRFVREQNIED